MLRIILFAILISLGAAGVQTAAAKSYQIPAADIEATLQSDGSLEVHEQRTYRFRDRYRHAYRTLPKRADISYGNFSIWENGQPYQLDDSKDKGTFRVSEDETSIEVRWFFSAKNEERTFEFRYQVFNLIKRHEDAALLYYQFIGDNWRKAQHNVRVKVKPPQAVSPENVRVWPHGPLWAAGTTGPDGSLLITCEKIPGKTYLEVRALYPPDLFPEAPQVGGTIVPEIMEEEREMAVQANVDREAAREALARKEHRYGIGRWLMPALTLLLFVGWFVLLQIYGRRPPIPDSAQHFAGIPSDRAPATVGYLLNSRQISARDMVATLLDLARRGFVSIEEKTIVHRGLFGSEKEKLEYIWTRHREACRDGLGKLEKHERMLIEFMFDRLAGGRDTIGLSEIGKKGSQMRTFYRKWSAAAKARAVQQQLYDEQSLTANIDRYLVSAVVLGLSKKHLENLAAQVPSHTLHSSVPWYAMHAAGGSDSSPAAFAGAFSAMVATASSTTSSAAGTGGGATSGGGGGAGGGGGGAG